MENLLGKRERLDKFKGRPLGIQRKPQKQASQSVNYKGKRDKSTGRLNEASCWNLKSHLERL